MGRIKLYGPLVAVYLIAMAGAVLILRLDAGPVAFGILFVLGAAAAGWFSGPIGHEIYLRQERSRQG